MTTKDYIKVKRGMVFTYNINPNVDKKDVSNNDHLQYGNRDFLVVSNDTNNSYSPTCNIVPITTSSTKQDIPTHVEFMYRNRKLIILCEHVYTINIEDLYKYNYTVSDEVMNRVNKALAVQFNLNVSAKEANIRMSLDKIESIIQGIISQKVEEATKDMRANDIDIEDAVLRLGDSLMTLLSEKTSTSISNVRNDESKDVVSPVPEKQCTAVASNATDNSVKKDSSENRATSRPITKIKVKPQSQVDKFYSRYPSLNTSGSAVDKKVENVSKSRKPRTSSGKPRRKWTPESMKLFIEDSAKLTPIEMVKKYEFTDTNDYYKTRYYVQNRLDGKL